MECFIYQSVNFENNSVLDFEPIQRMENRCYMAELRCLVSAFVVQSSTYIIYLILCGLDYQISFMLPFGCLEYHIYYLSGG